MKIITEAVLCHVKLDKSKRPWPPVSTKKTRGLGTHFLKSVSIDCYSESLKALFENWREDNKFCRHAPIIFPLQMVFSRNLSNGKKLYNPGFIKQQHHKEQWFFITAILNIRVLGTHLLASQLQPNTWFSSWPTLAKYCQPAPVTAPSPNTQESIWLVQLCDKALNSICTIPGAGCPTPALLSLPSPKLLKSKLSLAGKCLSDNDCDSNGWHHWNLLWCWHKNTMSHDNATIAVFEKKKKTTH